MITKLYRKIDKKIISTLPRVLFSGRIIVIDNEKDADKAVKYLLSSKIIGIDTETRPSFRKGVYHKVALLQASTHSVCFLFRLNVMGFPTSLLRLVEDMSVIKVGISLHDDLMMIGKRTKFKKGNFIDLQDLIKNFGIEDMSLQKLYANLFHERIVKREQLSNWEAIELSERQKLYAATDAWACIKIYEKMMQLSKDKNYELITLPNSEVKVENNIQTN